MVAWLGMDGRMDEPVFRAGSFFLIKKSVGEMGDEAEVGWSKLLQP